METHVEPSSGSARQRRETRPFDVELLLTQLKDAVALLPKPALFELYDWGYTSTFQQVVACLISVRTVDEVTLPEAKRLLERAPTPRAMNELSVEAIDSLITRVTFHRQKAARLKKIAALALEYYGGEIPCERAVILSLPGIGPKCANLVMSLCCATDGIAVDTHVHRVVNRWGLVSASTATGTLAQLEELVPRRLWNEINHLMTPFGKFVCTHHLPHCSTCPLWSWCQQVGVERHR